ncbi:MAG: class I SAM-dependent methyltransferase, partial [Kovacikia sp.]
ILHSTENYGNGLYHKWFNFGRSGMKICTACGEQFSSTEWTCPACKHTPEKIDRYLMFAPKLAETSPGFEAVFFNQLVKLEASNFWFCSRNRLIIWALRHYFSDISNFLEIGCGTGYVLSGIESAFPKFTLFGSEIFTTGLEFASQRLSRTTLFQMDARQIPFQDEFDVIGAFDVLEHIQEDTGVLAEIYQAVKSGGGLLLTVPQHPWLWSQADDYAHHVRRYSARELKTKVEKAGFKVIRITSFISLLLPLMVLSRSQRQQARDYDATSEFRISGWMNSILTSILDLERKLIQIGVRFPAGGSLLLIAKKQ